MMIQSCRAICRRCLILVPIYHHHKDGFVEGERSYTAIVIACLDSRHPFQSSKEHDRILLLLLLINLYNQVKSEAIICFCNLDSKPA